jgi:predicted MFS family arabinose efflux permease
MEKNILPKNKAIIIFLVFAFGYFLSCLLRAVTATLSPVLSSEFNLNAGDLGLLAGGYFLGFATMQIPLGYLLDNYGPKKIVSAFLLIAIIGTLSFAVAQNFSGLLISRVLIGIGVSACLMGPLTGYRIWFKDKYQQRSNSWMLMVASLGFVFSTLPVQILLPFFGWRYIFFTIAGLIVICIFLLFIFLPNWKNQNSTKITNKSGNLSEVWSNKFFQSTIPLGLFNYGGIMAIQTLWAGPWMVRVTGYTPLESATGLFWINVTMLIAFLIWGFLLPKISSSVKDAVKLIKLGLPISYIILFILIILGEKAGVFLITFYILTSIVLSLAQPAVAMKFPTNLAGKSLTSFNLLIFVGTFIVQWSIGLLIDISRNYGFDEVKSFQISFMVYLLICILSYSYFVFRNRDA